MTRDRKPSQIRGRGVNLGLAMASIVLTLVFLEVLLRFTSYRYIIMPNYFPPHYFKADATKDYDISENIPMGDYGFGDWDSFFQFEIWSNELGCCDHPYGGEKGYILVIGDSFSQTQAPFKDQWGTLMEELLETRVLKCGVAGYATRQEFLKTKDIIGKVKNPPQVIVVGHFISDLEEDYAFLYKMQMQEQKKKADHGERHSSPPEFMGPGNHGEEKFRKGKLWLQEHSILYVLARESFNANISFHPVLGDLLTHIGLLSAYRYMEFASPESAVIREAWKIHLQNISEFKELAERTNSRLLFVLFPRKEQVYPWLRGWSGVDPEGPNRMLRHFFESQEICYIDLLPLLKSYANPTPRKYLDREKDLYWRYDGHLNSKGNQLTGLLVSKYVLEQGLVSVKDSENALQKINLKLAHFH